MTFLKTASPIVSGIHLDNRPKLLKHDRLRLIEAQAQGKPTVRLLIATVPGLNEAAIHEIGKLGGRLQFRADDVGYLRVKVPIANVETIANSPYVEALNIDGGIGYKSNALGEVAQVTGDKSRIPPPNRDTPAENPYLPTQYIDAPQFVAQHPTFDGRGVTIAFVDTSVDLLRPELQVATTLDGKPTRKVLAVLNSPLHAVDPSDDEGQLGTYLKVEMQHEASATDEKIVYGDVAYVAPSPAHYRIGMIDERLDNPKGDLNRDGNPPDSSGLFAVLWNEETNTVWVDTNQNHSFADETPMTDYQSHYDVGIFGRDNPATAVQEETCFSVQTDKNHQLIFINVGNSFHGTAVAGVATGRDFFGGKVNGVAPGARVVSVPISFPNTGPSFHSIIESFIVAARHPDVDLVSGSVTIEPRMNDGNSTFGIICNRLIEKYKKPLFLGAGNAGDEPGIISESASASKVIAVGSYLNRETSRVNYGVPTVRAENIDFASSRGPTRSGGLKPNILAPTLSLTVCPANRPGETQEGTYTLPPGYCIIGGTSAATPMAAGAAALLISAARQSGIRYEPDRLRWAMMSSARYLHGYGAYEQGTGLIQLKAAWAALRTATEPVQITSMAPVNVTLSQYLREPNRGSGIFEREGWRPGETAQRMIVFTRTSGPSRPFSYSLTWIGNDGTFTAPKTVRLPLNEPVTIAITVAPKTAGIHSAILNLNEPAGAQSIYQLLNTVVAAEQLTAANSYTISHEGQAEWMEDQSYYVNVPQGTPMFKVDVQIASGNVRVLLVRPVGVPFYKENLGDTPAKYFAYQTGGSLIRTIVRPEPGVWQVEILNKNVFDRTRFAAQKARFTVSAKLLGVEARPQLITLDSKNLPQIHTKELTIRNNFGTFTDTISTSPLGSAFTSRLTFIAPGRSQVYEIDVPAGALSLSASVSESSDPSADLDLYLFDCTGKECVLKDFSQRNRSNEQVTIQQPAAGKWKIIIDPFSLPSSRVTCDYLDFFTHSAFGSITVRGDVMLRPVGAKWKKQTTIEIDSLPSNPRYLAGLVPVTMDLEPAAKPGQPHTLTGSTPTAQFILGGVWFETTTRHPLDGPIK